MPPSQLVPGLAIASSGLVSGALLFVSFVETRVILNAVSRGDDAFLRAFFPIWWPYGRDLMAPLVGSSLVANAFAWYKSGTTSHAVAAGTMLFILVWTKVVLGEDIAALRAAGPAGVFDSAKSFCFKHHVRAVIALGSFLWSLYKERGN